MQRPVPIKLAGFLPYVTMRLLFLFASANGPRFSERGVTLRTLAEHCSGNEDMKNIVGIVVLCALAGCSVLSGGADRESQSPIQPEDLTPASWVALGKAGPSHKLLDMFVGDWKTRTIVHGGNVSQEGGVSSYKEAAVYSGKAKIRWILGDRFLQEEFEGEMMSVIFSGLGIMGYDNGARRFTNVWVDSLSTALVFSTGKYFAEQNRFEYEGSVYDPLVGRHRGVRTVLDVVSQNEYVVNTYEPGPDGRELKTLEIRYERT